MCVQRWMHERDGFIYVSEKTCLITWICLITSYTTIMANLFATLFHFTHFSHLVYTKNLNQNVTSFFCMVNIKVACICVGLAWIVRVSICLLITVDVLMTQLSLNTSLGLLLQCECYSTHRPLGFFNHNNKNTIATN